jgi:hypothetical protein
MTDADADDLAARLGALPVYELVDLLRRVLPAHSETEPGAQMMLTLAKVTRSEDQETQVDVVAWPDRDHYGGGLGPHSGLWQYGTCRRCEIPLVSNAKHGLCPVCGTPSYLS